MDPESASEYVRSFLGKRFRVVLFDENRQIVGTFVALDASGTLFLRQCVVRTPNGENRVTTVLVKTGYIQHIELVL
jgi:small nuclear ribonucleoprotein (snRNP)-like protein